MSTAGQTALAAGRGRTAVWRSMSTTPARLRLMCAVIAVAAIVFAAVAAHAAGERRRAVEHVAATEALLVSAVKLSAALSSMHATAALSFLRNRPEPTQSLRVYEEEMQRASARVVRLTREIEASFRSGAAVRRVTQTLPVYSGLIENARANHRQDFPVGSAYLPTASKSMRDAMLPATRDLYGIEAQNLTGSYRAGMSRRALVVVVAAGCLLALVLACAQVYLTHATRRIINPGLALASVLFVGLMVWIVAACVVQQSALARAQRTGSDPVELLTATRILALRAQADESVALAARGGGEAEPRLKDVDRGFRAVTLAIGRLLMKTASISGGDAGRSRAAIRDAYHSYLVAHADVVAQVKRGNFSAAVQLAVGPRADGSPSTRAASETFGGALDREVRIAQRRFDGAAVHAGNALDGLGVGIPVVTALSGLLALVGIRQRLEEYR